MFLKSTWFLLFFVRHFVPIGSWVSYKSLGLFCHREGKTRTFVF